MRGNALPPPDRALQSLIAEGLARSRAWLVSLGLHFLIIIALALWQFPFFGLLGSATGETGTFSSPSIIDPEAHCREEELWPEGATGETSAWKTADFEESLEATGGERDSGRGEYGLCGDRNPDVILVVWITIPNCMKDRAFKMPLRLWKSWENDRIYGHTGCFSDGPSSYSGIFLSDSCGSDTSIEVSLSGYWRATDGTKGSLDADLPVEIAKPSSKDLGGGVKIRWDFEAPPK